MLIRHVLLGTEAVYEVVEDHGGPTVTVRVVNAPHLEPGTIIKLAREDC